ncbi:MAG: fluoride efflux transporter CrcB [Thermoanaerobaculia bacterium]|nr:fluoride efflux transporter CrcB [Thermoanaerobaculia bacterium]
MRTFFLVILGGAAGTGVRYLVALMMGSGWRFPVATLAVNIAGSFVIGFVVPWAIRSALPAPLLAAITTGFLGGFTTYSAFNYELTVMATSGQAARALVYGVMTVCGCFVAGLAGLHFGR